MQETYVRHVTSSESRSLLAHEIMSYPAITAGENTSIKDVAKLMTKHGIDAVVIADKQNMPVGIVTEGDIVRRLVSAKKNLWFVKASHVMSKPVITIHKNTTIEEAAKRMADGKVKKLCVVDENGRLAGMLTSADITKNAGYLINVLKEVIHTGYVMEIL